jgi:hypothetical protein
VIKNYNIQLPDDRDARDTFGMRRLVLFRSEQVRARGPSQIYIYICSSSPNFLAGGPVLPFQRHYTDGVLFVHVVQEHCLR